MIVEIPMPSLGLTMEEGIVVEWFKKQGDTVEEGEPLFMLETEKTMIEINASTSGILTEIILPIGEAAKVGHIIAVIDTGEEDYVTGSPNVQLPESENIPSEVPGGPDDSSHVIDHETLKPSEDGTVEKIRATPVARRVAQEAGISLKNIQGTGPNGTISREDVEKAITNIQTEPELITEEIQQLSGIRAVIADRMAESARTTAPVTLSAEADATELVKFRDALTQTLKQSTDIKPSYNDILVAILAIGLSEFPRLNAHLINNEIHVHRSIHIGVAVDTERGLVVPVIKDVANKKISDITLSSNDLVSRARSSSLLPDELSGGTFTLTNLGMFGIDFFTPIINLPETAILGVGKITAVPSVINEQIEIRKKMILSLTFDHRIVDGALAARFLQRIVQLIDHIEESPLTSR